MTRVGRSWRTYAKHRLMRSFLGREVGAANSMRKIHRQVWLDLTAGDAVMDEEPWHENCSPGIIAYHATHAKKPVDIWLYEIQPATYDRLLGKLEDHLPTFGYERVRDSYWRITDRVTLRTVNMSGHHASIATVRRGDAVVVLNDPNAITEWAMRPTFAREIAARTPWFRSLSTMGCNPAGLKRLKIEERRGWFGLVRQQQIALPPHRDLLLAAIERDDAQWAYLICDPGKWRSQMEKVVETAFRSVGRTTALSWYRQQGELFEEQKRTLFFTKSEREEMGL